MRIVAAARRGQLMWLTLILAAVTLVLTPITIDAGAWLYDRQPNPSPILREHAARGIMTYFSAALLVVAVLLVALRMVERRSDRRRVVLHAVVAIVVLATGIASTLQIYRVGDAGAHAVWGG